MFIEVVQRVTYVLIVLTAYDKFKGYLMPIEPHLLEKERRTVVVDPVIFC